VTTAEQPSTEVRRTVKRTKAVARKRGKAKKVVRRGRKQQVQEETVTRRGGTVRQTEDTDVSVQRGGSVRHSTDVNVSTGRSGSETTGTRTQTKAPSRNNAPSGSGTQQGSSPAGSSGAR